MAQIVKHTIDAVYEDGAFRPLAPLDEPIAEGQKVRIRVETVPSPEEMTKLAASVYEGLTDEEIDEIEKSFWIAASLATASQLDAVPSPFGY